MNQTPMTTREAVHNLCLEAAAACDEEFMEGGVLSESVKLLCEQYGLRLQDYFQDA